MKELFSNKSFILLTTAVLVVSGFFVFIGTVSAVSPAIGDTYRGGKVAYILQSGDPGYVEGETNGFIAAPSDLADAPWGCNGTTTGADGTALGTGNQNTIDIMAGCSTPGIAARLCGDLVLNGYSDWYLPSKDELNKLYLNQVAIGGFNNPPYFDYWTSTELDSGNAWGQYFANGNQYGNGKSLTYIHVRPIRSFSVSTNPGSDATLKASSTIKGETISSLGTPSATIGSATGGTVTINTTQAADISNTGGYITSFIPIDVGATVTKVVKYATGDPITNFATDTAYNNEAITDQDFFIVEVTAEDSSVLYYKVVVTVVTNIVSAKITSPTQFTIVYSAPVDAVYTDYSNLSIDGHAATSVDSMTGAGTATHVITFTPSVALTTASTGVVDIAALADGGSGNTFAGQAGQVLADGRAPTLAEHTAVPTPTADNTPAYTFTSTEGGTVTYGGSCGSGDVQPAVAGLDTTTYSTPLADNTYSDCTIKVTDSAGNQSNILTLSTFVVDTSPATTPSLGAAATFGVLSSTFTVTTSTTINGDVGYTTPPGTPATINGTTYAAPNATYTQAGTDQATALGNLNSQGCNFSFGSDKNLSTLSQPLVPGVYCIAGDMSIGASGITLNGSGTYIFRSTGALNTADSSSVTLTDGAYAGDVFWTPGAAATLGATTIFKGTVIDNAGITVGAGTVWTGRALDFATTVTTDTDTITVPVPTSSDATLTTASTIKGVAISDLGTPDATLGSETAGTVTITSLEAINISNAGSYITSFVANDAGATITKVVKYATGGTTANFATDAAYANEAIAGGDFFIVKVTAADSSVLYYRIVVTVTPPTGTVSIDQAYINIANSNLSFTFADAQVGATYNYSIRDTGAGELDDSGTVASATQTIGPIDVSGLADGTLTLAVQLTDAAGNSGGPSTDTVTKDTVAPVCPTPTITLTSHPESQYVSPSYPYLIQFSTNTSTAGSFDVAVDATDVGGSGVQKVNFPNTVSAGGEDSSAPYSNDYSWDASDNTAAYNGVIRCYDDAGNEADSSLNVFADNANPTLTSITLDKYLVKNGGTIHLNSNAADGDSGLATCNEYWSADALYDGGDTYLGNDGCNGIDITVPVEVGDVTRYIILTPVDNVGNVGTPFASDPITVDNAPPVISATVPADDARISAPKVSYTLSEPASSATIVFSQFGGGPGDPGSPHTCALRGTALDAGAHTDLTLATDANACDNWADPLLNDVNYEVTFDATDVAGNDAATVTNTNIVYDSAPPTGTVTLGSPTINKTNLVQVVTVTFDEAMDPSSIPNITFTSTPTLITPPESEGPGVWSATHVANDTWTQTFDLADDNEEIPSVQVDGAFLGAKDLAGNVEGADNPAYFAVDTIAPSIDSVIIDDGGDGIINSLEATSGVDINITTTGVEDGQTVTCNITDSGTGSVGPVTGTISGNAASIASGNLSSLADGAITVSCSVSDAAGNGPATNGSGSMLHASVPALQSFSTATPPGTYGPGSPIDVTATYDENVSGSLSLTLNNGGSASITCSGSTTCSDTYTVGVTGSGQDWTGLDVSSFTQSVTDDYGNNTTDTTMPGTTITSASSINVDTTAPTLSPVSIASSNTNPAFARTGDTVTLSFTANETLATLPTVYIAGNLADAVNDLGSGNFSATRVMQSGDPEGNVTFSIDFADQFGNIGTQVTTVDTGVDVTFDITPPHLNLILGNGASPYSLPSLGGSLYGVTTQFSEALSTSAKTAVENALSAGSDNPLTFNWGTLNRLRISSSGTTATFANNVTVSLTDLAGNTSPTLLLVLSVLPSQVYVDSSYTYGSSGGHIWGYDGFAAIQNGVNGVAASGTVNVASGTYASDTTININTPGITLTGPTPVVSGSLPFVQNTSDNIVISLHAANVHIVGLKLEGDCSSTPGDYCSDDPVVRVGGSSWTANNSDIDSNEIAGGAIGIAVNYQSTGTTIQNNTIHDSSYDGVVIRQNVSTIENNEFYNDGVGISMACYSGPSCDLSGTTISGNNIHNNSSRGIEYYVGDQTSAVTIGPNNDIHNNNEGIYVSGNAHNLFVNGNKIHNNILLTSGLHIENDLTGMDATKNWWDDSSGPVVTDDGTPTLNNGGSGETIDITNSNFMFYRPFCTNDACTTFSTTSATPDDLSGLFDTGVFVLPSGSLSTSTSGVQTAEDLTVDLSDGSSVVIPTGVTIAEEASGTFDASALSAQYVNASTITDMGSGTVVDGALEWGITGTHLTFNPAITLNIFVGTALNGQTLNIERKPSSGTWTSDGIVAPATCVVSSGICTFQATKASTYASVTPPSGGSGGTPSGGGGGGGGGVYPINGTCGSANGTSYSSASSILTLNLCSAGNYSTISGSGPWTWTCSGINGGSNSPTCTANKSSVSTVATDCMSYTNVDDQKACLTNLIAQLTQQIAQLQGQQSISSAQLIGAFTKNLQLGSVDPDVKLLQQYLNKNGFIIANSGPGSPGNETNKFGALTKQALIKFQKAKNISPAVGYFGLVTRKFINQ